MNNPQPVASSDSSANASSATTADSLIPTTPTAPAKLKRQLGVSGAVVIGLGSILGTGVFVSIGLAAGLVAGSWLIPAVLVAGLLASCNALSSAQLAAAYPVSGGTYAYGYRLIHPLAGRSAGWLFLLAKSASAATACVAIAQLFGAAQWWWPPIIALLMLAVVLAGLRRSNRVNTGLVLITLLGLMAVVIAAAFFRRHPSQHQQKPITSWQKILLTFRLKRLIFGHGSKPPPCCLSLSPVTVALPPWLKKFASLRAPFHAPLSQRWSSSLSYTSLSPGLASTYLARPSGRNSPKTPAPHC